MDLLHGHNTDREAKAMYKLMIVTENDTDQDQCSSMYCSSNSGSGSKLPIAVKKGGSTIHKLYGGSTITYTNCMVVVL